MMRQSGKLLVQHKGDSAQLTSLINALREKARSDVVERFREKILLQLGAASLRVGMRATLSGVFTRCGSTWHACVGRDSCLRL